jgi:hypothetical protein
MARGIHSSKHKSTPTLGTDRFSWRSLAFYSESSQMRIGFFEDKMSNPSTKWAQLGESF